MRARLPAPGQTRAWPWPAWFGFDRVPIFLGIVINCRSRIRFLPCNAGALPPITAHHLKQKTAGSPWPSFPGTRTVTDRAEQGTNPPAGNGLSSMTECGNRSSRAILPLRHGRKSHGSLVICHRQNASLFLLLRFQLGRQWRLLALNSGFLSMGRRALQLPFHIQVPSVVRTLAGELSGTQIPWKPRRTEHECPSVGCFGVAAAPPRTRPPHLWAPKGRETLLRFFRTSSICPPNGWNCRKKTPSPRIWPPLNQSTQQHVPVFRPAGSPANVARARLRPGAIQLSDRPAHKV